MKRSKLEICNLWETEDEIRVIKKLEHSLFGCLCSPPPFGEGEETGDGDQSPLLFYLDNFGAQGSNIEDVEFPSVLRPCNNAEGGYWQGKGLHSVDEQRKPKWVDEEEETCKINIASVNKLRKLRKTEGESVISGSDYLSRLRAQHVKMNPGTEWAHPKSRDMDGGEDSEDENLCVRRFEDVMQSNCDLVTKSSSRLSPGVLEYLSVNQIDASKKNINSVQFHRNAQLLLTAGEETCFKLCHIYGENKIHMVKKGIDFVIRKASFLPEGSEVILAGRRNTFYAYDLGTEKLIKSGTMEEKSLEVFEVSLDSTKIAFLGNGGNILMVSSKTKQLINTLKMNGSVRSVAFTNDGLKLMSLGGDGKIYHWDLRMGKCFRISVDEGCVEGTFFCIAPTGDLFAAGSSCGIVNVYDKKEDNCLERREQKPRPVRTFENLTTRVSFMKFNHDAQILAICSKMKKNSLKLIHVPSYSVFSNWPPVNCGLTFTCLDFSPQGGFMAVGNMKGSVSLYRLPHYHRA